LFGGFASTVCWPLGAALVDAYGWRTTSLIYAAIHLAIALPMQMIAIPRAGGSGVQASSAADPPAETVARASGLSHAQRTQFALLALVMTISSAVGAIVIVHLLIFLQARGADFALAVTLGTLFGPVLGAIVARGGLVDTGAVVAPEVTDRRITQSSRHCAPAAKQTPSFCTRAITASVAARRAAASRARRFRSTPRSRSIRTTSTRSGTASRRTGSIRARLATVGSRASS